MNKRNHIKQQARTLFLGNSIRDVSIVDIMQAAGWSVGTFYNYFSSKDELLFELYIDENVSAKRNVLSRLDMSASPADVIAQFLVLSKNMIAHNNILAAWYDEDFAAQLMRYSSEAVVDSTDFVREFFADTIKQWHCQGLLRRDIEPAQAMRLFVAISYLDAHKSELQGVDDSETIELIIAAVVNYLGKN